MPVTADTLRRYLNPVFVETGSFYGDGIAAAIEAGFPHIRSIELSEKHHEHCQNRFANEIRDGRVQLYLGDSADPLAGVGGMIADINLPITFWLDAHYSGGDTVMGRFDPPLALELAAIGNHEIKTHTLLIDDMQNYQITGEGAWERAIWTINRAYRFSKEAGHTTESILVAMA